MTAHLPAGAVVSPVASLFCQPSPALATDHAVPRLPQLSGPLGTDRDPPTSLTAQSPVAELSLGLYSTALPSPP